MEISVCRESEVLQDHLALRASRVRRAKRGEQALEASKASLARRGKQVPVALVALVVAVPQEHKVRRAFKDPRATRVLQVLVLEVQLGQWAVKESEESQAKTGRRATLVPPVHKVQQARMGSKVTAVTQAPWVALGFEGSKEIRDFLGRKVTLDTQVPKATREM